jgi:hypothetical protein
LTFHSGQRKNALRSAQPTNENASELDSQAPDGKVGNWRTHRAGQGYFAILRLYGPAEAGLDKGWKPGDIVKME